MSLDLLTMEDVNGWELIPSLCSVVNLDTAEFVQYSSIIECSFVVEFRLNFFANATVPYRMCTVDNIIIFLVVLPAIPTLTKGKLLSAMQG
jgi:hypothetical protein